MRKIKAPYRVDLVAALKNHEIRIRQLEGFVVGLIQAGNRAADEATAQEQNKTTQEENVNADQLELALPAREEQLGSLVPGGPEGPSVGTVFPDSGGPNDPSLSGVGNPSSEGGVAVQPLSSEEVLKTA